MMRELLEALVKLLSPMAPYITAEAWRRMGHDTPIHEQPWPSYEPHLATEEQVTMVVQIDGKVRDTLTVSADASEAEMRAQALASDRVRSHLVGRDVVKVIAKPPRLLSLVTAKE